MAGSGQVAGRRTNMALLVLVALSLLTGTLSYALGSAPATLLVTTAHGALGLALVLLVPWKQAVARRGLRRPAHRGRTAGLALAVLLLLTVVAGVAQAAFGWGTVLGLAPLQVHVAAALLAAPLLVGHLVTHWQPPRRVDVSRRTLLSAGLVGAGGLFAVLGVDGITRALGLPGARDRPTGSSERGSFEPALMPVTQWFLDSVPSDVRALRVVVDEQAVEPDLAALAHEEVEAVLDCTGGWYAAQRWGGVRMDRLLPATLPVSARSIDVVSATGYRRRFPLDDAPRLLLATSVGGRPLSPGHGAPLRLIAPGRRGFWWVKWVVAVEVSDAPPWAQPPFPLT